MSPCGRGGWALLRTDGAWGPRPGSLAARTSATGVRASAAAGAKARTSPVRYALAGQKSTASSRRTAHGDSRRRRRPCRCRGRDDVVALGGPARDRQEACGDSARLRSWWPPPSRRGTRRPRPVATEHGLAFLAGRAFAPRSFQPSNARKARLRGATRPLSPECERPHVGRRRTSSGRGQTSAGTRSDPTSLLHFLESERRVTLPCVLRGLGPAAARRTAARPSSTRRPSGARMRSIASSSAAVGSTRAPARSRAPLSPRSRRRIPATRRDRRRTRRPPERSRCAVP
jgi:hypothetical protein